MQETNKPAIGAIRGGWHQGHALIYLLPTGLVRGGPGLGVYLSLLVLFSSQSAL